MSVWLPESEEYRGALIGAIWAVLFALGLFVPASDVGAQGILKHPPGGTVADLPTCNAARDWTLRGVSDGASGTDCSTGGGSTAVLCQCDNGVGWAAVQGSGGGHGDGANCAAGEIPLGVDASGAVQGCYEPAAADISDVAAGTDITADLEEEAHASEHSDGAADEITAENLATSCTDGQILEASTGGWVCGADDTGGGGAATSLDYDGDATNEVVSDGTTIDFDADDDGTAEAYFSADGSIEFYPGGGRAGITTAGEFSNSQATNAETFGAGSSATTHATSFGVGASGGVGSVNIGPSANGNGTYTVAVGRNSDVSSSSPYGMAIGPYSAIPAPAAGGGIGWIHMGQSVAAGSYTESTAWMFLGPAVVTATPADAGISTGRASGTDTAGADFIVAGGVSTGTGAGGSVRVQVSPAAGSTSSTRNALVDALTVDEAGVTVDRGLMFSPPFASAPTCDAAADGGRYYDTSGAECLCVNGTGWVSLGGPGTCA